jgi:hypothetical protein
MLLSPAVPAELPPAIPLEPPLFVPASLEPPSLEPALPPLPAAAPAVLVASLPQWSSPVVASATIPNSLSGFKSCFGIAFRSNGGRSAGKRESVQRGSAQPQVQAG